MMRSTPEPLLVSIFTAILAAVVGCQTAPIKKEVTADDVDVSLQAAARVSGRSSTIKVVIDSVDVPHVLADRAADAYFAQGFLHAYYRLWQMDFRARSAEGTSGLITKGSLTVDDAFAQKAELLEAALRTESQILADPELKSYALAYCEGVNARIRQLTTETMPERYRERGLIPRQWAPLHIALAIVASSWGQAQPVDELQLNAIKHKISDKQFRKFFPPPPKKMSSAKVRQPIQPNYALTLEQLQGSPNTGSNAFSVHGSRTASGRPIIANDFHLDYLVPTLLLPMQLVSSEFNTFGATSIGIPGIMSGTNQHMAWTVVKSMADTADWFRLKFRDSTQQEYRWNGRWEKVVTKVRETRFADGSVSTVKVRTTAAGPLLPVGQNGEELALSWIGSIGKTTFLPFVRLPLARRAEECGQTELVESLSHVVLSCTDSSNSILELIGGPIPNRRDGADPRIVATASSTRDLWNGYQIPGKNFRNTAIPDYSVNANSAPDHFAGTASFYLGWEFSPPFRRDRIIDLLKSNKVLTVADALQIQTDITDYRHGELAKLFPLALGQNKNPNKCEKTLISSLQSWDGKYTVHSTVAPLYQDFLNGIWRRLVPPEFGSLGAEIGSVRLALFQTLLSGLKSQNRQILDAVLWSAAEICRLGASRPAWGLINRAQFHTYGTAGAAATEGVEAPGGMSTVFSQNKTRGTVWQTVIELDKRPQIWFSSIGRLRGDTTRIADAPWTKRWSKLTMAQVPFLERADFFPP